jgi:hypothetical protein
MHTHLQFILMLGMCTLTHPSLFSQNGTVVSGGGGAGLGGTISYSIGQVDYVNISSGTGSINQGLQQPYEIYQYAGLEDPSIYLELALYPNPTTDMVQLVVKNLTNEVKYLLYDATGRILEQQQVKDNLTILDLQHLAAGNYFLHVYTLQSEIKTYKIIKK